jgi:mono/diheme cytochrome c family protein
MACQQQAPEEKSPAPSAEQTRLERGRYLVENVAHCFFCHSELDWTAEGAPPKPGRAGAGAVFPDENIPFLLVASNITPDPETGIGQWSDEDLGRAVREGVGRDGRRLFPMMPYELYRGMSDEDLAAVIAYLRSVPSVRSELAKTELPEPVKEMLPPHQPVAQPVPPPDALDPVKRGAYLAQIAECAACHTPVDHQKMQPIMVLAFAGGLEFKGPWGLLHSPNITMDASGIAHYDEALFLQVMKTGNVGGRKLNSIMPWGYTRHMTDDDLKAVFAFLKTLPPVAHRVDNTEKAMLCKQCGAVHGLGADNQAAGKN